MNEIVTRGKNITQAQLYLLEYMDSQDVSQLINVTVSEIVSKLPNPNGIQASIQGLMLGLVQSGKTGALAATLALAADNGYRCFVVLTSDNLWLYAQTMDRLKEALPGLQIAGKDDWEQQFASMTNTLLLTDDGLVLVSTKNAVQLQQLAKTLNDLKHNIGSELPAALVIDDEADQASLDTQTSRRATDASIDPGRTNALITTIRKCFPYHAYLQVTATPQALFLQDISTLYRPEFTVLVEPGKGYVGGSTFFSLIGDQSTNLLRKIDQSELDNLLTSNDLYVPPSLKSALCLFFVGATIKSLQEADRGAKGAVYTFLCHISQKKVEHEKAFRSITEYYQTLRIGLSKLRSAEDQRGVREQLSQAYNDLSATLMGDVPSFQQVVDELAKFIVGTDIQVLNSDKEQDQPSYNRRYNILIGGTKLARGVTIRNLLVTYYGRQAKTTNMDTMLQHARMYGYRQRDLEVIRLFVTDDVAERFRLINESEEALRAIVQKYPNEEYRGIVIGRSLNPTRRNVLNPDTVGAYGAGRAYFPRQPLYQSIAVTQSCQRLDRELGQYPTSGPATQISIDRMLDILRTAKWSSDQANGLWDDNRIITAIETLKQNAVFDNVGYLVVRQDRNTARKFRDGFWQVTAVLSQTDQTLRSPVKEFPVMYMFREEGRKANGWDDSPFWLPIIWFPDGRYALMFNFE